MANIISRVSCIFPLLAFSFTISCGCRHAAKEEGKQPQTESLEKVPGTNTAEIINEVFEACRHKIDYSDFPEHYNGLDFIHFDGKVKSVEIAGQRELYAIPVGSFDLNWIIVVELETKLPLETKYQAGETVNFAVHSPTRVFAMAGESFETAAGKRYRFVLQKGEDNRGYIRLEARKAKEDKPK